MTKEPEWVECVSVQRRTTVAMEVKREDAVLYCALIGNTSGLFCYIYSTSSLSVTVIDYRGL